jgi:N-acetylmuramoyl-L-alanine amidase
MAIPLSAQKGGSSSTYRLSSPLPSTSRLHSSLPRISRKTWRSLSIVIALAFAAALQSVATSTNSSERRQEARDQFEKAEQMREALNGRPSAERTRKGYLHVADAYRKVYYVAPASSKADASVVAVAEILADTGRQFQPGDKDLRAAIGEYEFLRHEYPGSKYRFQALFTIGQIYKEDLGDNDAARQTFQEFLHRYPRNALAPDAKQALAELNKPAADPAKKAIEAAQAARNAENARAAQKSGPAPSPDKPDVPRAYKAEAESPRGEKTTPPPEVEPADLPPADLPASAVVKKKSPLPMVTGIRHWSTPDYTRVAIDVDAEVKYEAGRVPDPDRIFFDLPNTKLASVLVGKSFEVRDGFLKKIRVAQYQPGYTRVVLEVADVSDYSAFLLPNPYRLIIDIHGRQPQSQTDIARANAAPSATTDEGVTAVEKEKSYRSVEKANEAKDAAPITPKAVATATSSAGQGSATSSRPPVTTATSSTKPVHKVVVDDDDDADAAPPPPTKTPATKTSGKQTASNFSHTGEADSTGASDSSADVGRSNSKTTKSAGKQTVTTASAANRPADPLFAGPRDTSGPELKATTEPTTAPTAVAVAPRSKDGKKTTKTAAATTPPAHEAAPTSFGDRSLTRTLGLKIGRIVIDAGHGGHDTGTIGPNGLMEKDLVLDVALRLGRLLETRLGADVTYTRDDDTFIPLETRTAIANEHQADLFVSIHANSSEDSTARGVETYYLNFTSNPDALEVAARENAVSQKSIFELQDLVKKITLKDKIDESRELATDVQESLYTGLAGRHSELRDRGVKKAPFVVLIGANMPSILAEISFVSNPTDESKLETPEYRQKIAESLYKGIAKYAGGLSGVKVASKFSKDAGQ